MKIVMFLEDKQNDNEAMRILNVRIKRTHPRLLIERHVYERIYWFWEDDNMFGSNFKSVTRRLTKFGVDIQKDLVQK